MLVVAALSLVIAPLSSAQADATQDYTVDLTAPASIPVYDSLTYGVTVATPDATSAAAATGIELTATLPAGLAFDSVPTGDDSPVASAEAAVNPDGTTTVVFTLKDLTAALSSFNFSATQVDNNIKDDTTVLHATLTGSDMPSGSAPSDKVDTQVTGDFEYRPQKTYSVVAGSDFRDVTYYFNVITSNPTSPSSGSTETFHTWGQRLTDSLPAGAEVIASSTALGSWTIAGAPADGQTATWVGDGEYGPSAGGLDSVGNRVWITVHYPDTAAFPAGSPPPVNTVGLDVQGHDGTWHSDPDADTQSVPFVEGDAPKKVAIIKNQANGSDSLTRGDGYWQGYFNVSASYVNSQDDEQLGDMVVTDSALDSGNAAVWNHMDVYNLYLSFNPALQTADVPYTIEYQTNGSAAWQAVPGSRTTGTDARLQFQTAGSIGYPHSDGGTDTTVDLPVGESLSGWRVHISPDAATSIASGSQVVVRTAFVPMYEGIDGTAAPDEAMVNTATVSGDLAGGEAIDPASDPTDIRVTNAIPLTTQLTSPSTLTVGEPAEFTSCLGNMSVNRSFADSKMSVVLPVGVQYDPASDVTRSNDTVTGTDIGVPAIGGGVALSTSSVTDDLGEHQVVTFTFDDLPAMRPIGQPSDRQVHHEGFCYTFSTTVLAQAYDPSDTTVEATSFGWNADPALADVPQSWDNYTGSGDWYDVDPNREDIAFYNTSPTVTTAGGLLISKQVRATEADPYTVGATVPQAGSPSWQVYVSNVLPDPITDAVLFDRLPVAGDGRDSQFPVTLTGPITGAPAGATVEYSTDATAVDNGDWGSDPAGATAWRITLGTVPSGANFTLTLPTAIPSGLDYGEKDTNTVSGAGVYHGAERTFGSNDANITVAAEPAITLVKKTDGTDVAQGPGPQLPVGSGVTWTYEVTNTGNVTLDDVTVVDADESGADIDVTCPATALAAGAHTTCTASGAAIKGQYHNSATATGTPVDANGDPIDVDKPTATDESWYYGVTTDLTLLKTGDKTVVTKAGEKVVYSFEVANNSNVPVTDLEIDDQLDAPAGPALEVSCPTTTLAADGGSTTCTGTYTVTQADLDNGSIDNIATATGMAAGQPVTSEESSWHVKVLRYTATKISDPKTGTGVNPGQTITYTLAVKNTGTVPVPASLSDDMSGVTDDAVYNSDAKVTGSDTDPTWDGKVLHWSGQVPVDGTVTIAYSVTVKSWGAEGDHTVQNVLDSPGCGGICEVTNPVQEPDTPPSSAASNPPTAEAAGGSNPPAAPQGDSSLASTGVRTAEWGILAGLLLLIGGLVLIAGTRRSEDE